GAETRGSLVSAITEDGPAQRAGLEVGDAITAIDGAPLAERLALTRGRRRRPVGTRGVLSIGRRGDAHRLGVTTEEQPARAAEPLTPAAPAPRPDDELDVELVPVTPDLAHAIEFDGEEGAVVSWVREGGAAFHAGLRLGDVIVEADRRAVRTPEDMPPALADDDVALLRVRRGEHAFYTVLRSD
ncbi:MAG: PDZ domain-containing protein, partial [Myxococcota bacterium]|nr:PDZ domain-containing protein [Myxococcota bacterium]